MTRKEYLKHNKDYFRGKKVKTVNEISNGLTKIPPGTTLTIRGKKSGFKLEGPKCEHCGISVYVSKVDCYSVELLEA